MMKNFTKFLMLVLMLCLSSHASADGSIIFSQDVYYLRPDGSSDNTIFFWTNLPGDELRLSTDFDFECSDIDRYMWYIVNHFRIDASTPGEGKVTITHQPTGVSASAKIVVEARQHPKAVKFPYKEYQVTPHAGLEKIYPYTYPASVDLRTLPLTCSDPSAMAVYFYGSEGIVLDSQQKWQNYKVTTVDVTLGDAECTILQSVKTPWATKTTIPKGVVYKGEYVAVGDVLNGDYLDNSTQTWSSSDESVLSYVNMQVAGGVFKAEECGTATLKTTVKGSWVDSQSNWHTRTMKASADWEVIEGQPIGGVVGLSLLYDKITMNVGEFRKLNAYLHKRPDVLPDGWLSFDNGWIYSGFILEHDGIVARTNQNDVIYALKPGTTTVTVRAGRLELPIEVTVLGDPNAVETVEVNDENAPVEYFNLQGIRVSNPQGGIFIRRQGTKTEKVCL